MLVGHDHRINLGRRTAKAFEMNQFVFSVCRRNLWLDLLTPRGNLGHLRLKSILLIRLRLGSAVATWADNPEKTLLDVLIQQESLMPDDAPLLKALWMRQQSLERR